MTDDIRERVAKALEEESDFDNCCRYCGVQEYPVDKDSNRIHGEDLTNAVEFHFDHEDICPSRLMPELLTETERLEAENAALRARVAQQEGYAAFLRSCALCGEPPETFEWYLAKEAEDAR
jgi:hypothetical protein